MRYFHTKLDKVTKKNADGTKRQSIIRNCRPLERLLLEHDRSVGADPDAIAVRRGNGQQLGYLRPAVAHEVYANLQAGFRYAVLISEITGGRPSAPTCGVNLALIVAEPDSDIAEVEKYCQLVAAEIRADLAQHRQRQRAPRWSADVIYALAAGFIGLLVVGLIIWMVIAR